MTLKEFSDSLWNAYGVYTSAGSTPAAFNRHILPILKEIRTEVNNQLDKDRDFALKLAQNLAEMFEMSFGNRDWEDLPEKCKNEWLASADELIERMN